MSTNCRILIRNDGHDLDVLRKALDDDLYPKIGGGFGTFDSCVRITSLDSNVWPEEKVIKLKIGDEIRVEENRITGIRPRYSAAFFIPSYVIEHPDASVQFPEDLEDDDPGPAVGVDIESFSDPVNHPSRYTAYNGLEVIDLTEQMNFNKGNAVKYIARSGFKSNEIEDLEKAAWYIAREISRVKKLQEI